MGKRKSRRKKQKYDPAQSLKPMRLDPALEPVARDLYDKACCGSKEHWSEGWADSEFKKDPELRNKFLSAAHEGMRAAQDYIVDRVIADSRMSVSEKILYRSISDSIAWQLIGGQLCYARRLFLGHAQPNLQQSNFRSVVAAAKSIVDKSPDAIPLLSDLTTFVQVGDILSFDPSSGLSIIEVKQGEVNQRISNFLNFYSKSGCNRALDYFLSMEGPHTAKQMQRMVRQTGRMSHIVEIIASGTSTDPDSGQIIHIPEEPVPIRDWDEELNAMLRESGERGWALNVIDDCLFVACYAEESMLKGSHVIFNLWFDHCGGDPESPRARLIDCIHTPTALPMFSRRIPTESMFDLLFGRKQICMALSLDDFMKKCETAGLKVRFGTNRETSRMEQSGTKPFLHRGRSIFIGNEHNEMALMDGVLFRAFYHSVSL